MKSFLSNRLSLPRSCLAAAATLLSLWSGAVWAVVDVNKNFNPINVAPGVNSVLTINLLNTATVAATSVAFTDNLPANNGGPDEVVATTLLSNTCGGTATIQTSPASVQLTGGTIPAGDGINAGTCQLRFNVQGLVAGTHINTIPAGGVTTANQGNNPQSASATLFVTNFVAPTGLKAVSDTVVHGGETFNYTLTLNNSNLAPLTGVVVPDTLPSGIVISTATPVASNTCGGNATTTSGGALADGSTSFRLNNATIPAAPPNGTGTCAVVFSVRPLDITTTRNGNLTNTVAANAIVTDQGVTNASPFSVATDVETGGTVTKSFSPSTIRADGLQESRLTINLRNRNQIAITGAAVTDTLPANTLVAPTPDIATNPAGCATVAAAAGATNIAMTNVNIAAVATAAGDNVVTSCQVLVDVVIVAGAAGNNGSITQTNNIANGSYGAGLPQFTGTGNVTLTGNNPITATKAFSPTTQSRGGVVTTTLTLTNAATTPAAITSLVDNIQSQMGTGFVVANPTNASNTCGSTFAPAAGATSFTVTDGAVPASGSCTFTFDVQVPADATFGNHTNQYNVSTALGGRNNVQAVLNVQNALSATKNIQTSPVPVGTDTRLRITLTNSTAAALTSVAFTDSLLTMNAAGNVLVSGLTAPVNGCGGTLTAVAGSTSFSLSGGTIPANSSCNVDVFIIGRKGVPLLTNLVNTIPAGGITSSGGSNGAPVVSNNLQMTTPHTVTKAFSPSSVPQGGTSVLTITLNNLNGATESDAIINTFSDDLNTMDVGGGTPDVVRIAAGAVTNCSGAVLTATPGTQLISLTGGTIPRGGNCTITVPVQVQTNATLGSRTNTVPVNALDTNLGNNTAAATAALSVITPITIAKSFSPSSFNTNQAGTTRLTFNITNANGSPALTGLAVSDLITGTMGAGHVIATPANPLNTCGGTLTATSGAASWTLTGGAIPSNSTCTVGMNINVPAIGTPATNTVPAAAVTTDQNLTNQNAASAAITRSQAPDLTVLNKNFVPDIINGGAASQLQLVFANTRVGAQTLTNVTLTDNFPSGVVVAAVPNPQFTGLGCSNAVFNAVPGGSTFTISGATINAQSTCTVTVNTTAFVDGNLTNTIPTNSMTSDQGASNPNNASKTLTIARSVNLQKYFDPNVIETGATSQLYIQIFNTNTVPRTGCTASGGGCGAQNFMFRDTLPSGVSVAAGAVTTTCAGPPTITDQTGVAGSLGAGDTIIQVNGGTFPPGSSCELVIPVTAISSSSFTNIIPANSIATNEGSTNPDPTQDVLRVVVRPTIAKAFTPTSIGVGGTSTLTLTLTNPNSLAILPDGFTGVSFTDVLTNMSIAAPGPAGGTCAGVGNNQFAAGQTTLNFSTLTLAANASCTVTVNVTSSVAGVHPNQTTGLSTNQTQAAGDPSNVANLEVLQRPVIAKAFIPATIGANTISQLQFTLSNPNSTIVQLASPAFSDVFPTSPGAMTLANSTVVTNTCGSTVQDSSGGALNTGDAGIRVNGGSIPANGSCTVTVNVTASVAGTYINTSSVLTSLNAGASVSPANANLAVNNGFPLSGFVYRDDNVNGSYDGAEDWAAGSPVFVNVVQGGVVVLSTTVNPGTGFYSFPNVVAGTYTVVVTDSAVNINPVSPSPFQFVNPTNGTQPASVGTGPALLYNFGLIDAGAIRGTVFVDTLTTANDGILQGAEVRLPGVMVRLTNCAGTVLDTDTTDGSGNYTLYAPSSVANGQALCVEEVQPAGYLSTGASVAATALPSGTPTAISATTYTYTRTGTERIQFNYSTAIRNYSNLNFAEVPTNSFTTDNSTTAVPGSVVYHPHQYIAGSVGTVTFSTTASANPAISGWQETVIRDLDCDGQFDSGEPAVTAGITLTAGQGICLLVREFVPSGAPDGASNLVTVTAQFVYSNANPALTDTQTHTDTTIVGTGAQSGLQLIKAVDVPTATPGTIITYTLTYRNVGLQPLTDIEVRDATPPFTVYVGNSALCVLPLPANLSSCTVTQQPADGATGIEVWSLGGSLAPSAEGQVQYRVRVQN